jgi:hypothetical protein
LPGAKTDLSVTGEGRAINPITLVNDEDVPGVLHVYGTNELGVKGWWPLFTEEDSASESESESDSGGSEGLINIVTDLSVMGSGTVVDPITLVNDEELPSPLYYYGTDEFGEKGFHPIYESDSGSDSDSGGGLIPYDIEKDWIEFEFRDIEAGTADEYVLDIKALVAYTINSVVLQTDDGTLTGVNVKIGATNVTGLSSVTVNTTITETAATGANSVAVGNKIVLNITTGYTGTPTLIRGKLNLTRT